MPIVRLSGKVSGKNDPKRIERAELLFYLFSDGWDIYNSNGDQTIHLSNIQSKIIESDAFVFTPSPSLEDYFNLTSIFVGFQTNDGDLKNKPALVLNSDGSWDSFLTLLDELRVLGTVKEHYSKYITVLKTTEELSKKLNETHINTDARFKQPMEEPDIISAGTVIANKTKIEKPKKNICVFCSASINKPEYLQDGYDMGKLLAERKLGCISGAGKTGIMGQVVKGAYENGGWSGGSNVPHIIEMEGLPDGLNEFWPRADIYTRMEIMIEESAAFVIMPGGMGTFQELLALLILKHNKDDLLKGKKIIIYNRVDEATGIKFWDIAINIINQHNKFQSEFIIVDSIDEIFKHL